MKKNNLTIVIAVILGLVGGYVLFAPNSSHQAESHDHADTAPQNQKWTCSMHPQIMQDNPGQCPLCGMDLIPVDNDMGGLQPNQFSMSEHAMALANVQTTVVEERPTDSNTMQLSGKITANESLNSVQSSYFNGRIETLDINTTGETVRRGQKLATIYSPELVAAQQELLTSAGLKETQPELYSAVRNKLKIWKLTEAQIQSMEKSGKVMHFTPIYANTMGTVIEKLVNNGDYVKAGQPLFKIANLNTVWAEFDAYETQIPGLEIGQKITVSTNAYKNDFREAKITFIEPTLNTSTRTVLVRAEMSNSKGTLKPGMFVNGSVKGLNASSAKELLVPSTAVMWTGKRSIVYVQPDNTQPMFEMREVNLGPLVNTNYTILSGLQAGETIVTNGTFTIDAAAQLNGKSSMMNHKASQSTDKMVVPPDFQKELSQIIIPYMSLKDALVAGDPVAGKKAAIDLVEKLKKEGQSALSAKSSSFWKAKKDLLVSMAQNLSKAEVLASQRKQFIELSQEMIAVVELFGIGQSVYHQFCPMANNNEGAGWLSFDKSIKNPYFGEVMLSCGKIIAELD